MIELVEAKILSDQMNMVLQDKKITKVTTLSSPHKFTFFHGDPQSYDTLLTGRRIGVAGPNGGQVRLEVEDLIFVFGDGVDLRYHEVGAKLPSKHQLLMEFDDGSALTGSTQMYGFLWCFYENQFDNPYYLVAKEKPSPFTDQFDLDYFMRILSVPGAEKLSTKAVLATEQRIPGLGNGVLQDIMYEAALHPKRKVVTYSEEDKIRLYHSVKNTLRQMLEQGGRDTEKDLFGVQGGYKTKVSKNTVGEACPKCGGIIHKEAYLGGSIYYCDGCQPLIK